MAYAEVIDPVVFPEEIGYGSKGGPRYHTTVLINDGAYEFRNQNWARSRGRWVVSHGVKDEEELDELEAFFHARGGRERGFLFWPPRPFERTGTDEPIGVGNGSGRKFQLRRNYTSGGFTRQQPVTRPKAGSVVVRVGGAVDAGATVDLEGGVVTTSYAPGVGVEVRADFLHYVPARFESDQFEVTLEGIVGHWEEIAIVEIKEPLKGLVG